MLEETNFYNRVDFKCDIKFLLTKVCEDYRLGGYLQHRIITVGYEDLNIVLSTNNNRYLIKILADFRDKDDRLRYLGTLLKVMESDIAHPKLYKSDQGYLYSIDVNETKVYLFVMQFIDGKTFFELGINPTQEEVCFLSFQAALINKIKHNPKYILDTWAIVNFIPQYQRALPYLGKDDITLIEPLISRFENINLTALPHCFVHGDILSSNVIKDLQGKSWIIDFSVSNYYPRIQELAVLSNMFIDHENPGAFEKNFQLALSVYQKEIQLSQLELKLLPVFIMTANAMQIIGAMNCIIEMGNSYENQYWLYHGRKGLAYTSALFAT